MRPPLVRRSTDGDPPRTSRVERDGPACAPPLPYVPLPSPDDLAAEAERIAERLCATHAVDELHADITDGLFDEMLHDAHVALATAIGEQVLADEQLVDDARAEWLERRAATLRLGTDVERLERLRDDQFSALTGLSARPEMPEPATVGHGDDRP